MPFLTVAQLKTHIYPGISNAITGNDNTILQAAIDAAIGEAKGYLSRYNVAELFDNFSATPGWVADPTLLMYVKNIAKWHFIVLANPNIETEDALMRYEQAIKWLSNIQAGKNVPINWPVADPEEKSTFFHVRSNPKRRNHFK